MKEKAFQDYYEDHSSHCYGCGRLNAHGLKIKSFWDQDETICRFTPDAYKTSIPGYVYGGLIASVIDLRPFPSMFHGMVKPELEKAHHKAAGKLPAAADANALVVLLPDWKGAAHDACQVQNSTKEAAIIVADADGRILARAQGVDLGEAALAALQKS